jgi:hypothetical protein
MNLIDRGQRAVGRVFTRGLYALLGARQAIQHGDHTHYLNAFISKMIDRSYDGLPRRNHIVNDQASILREQLRAFNPALETVALSFLPHEEAFRVDPGPQSRADDRISPDGQSPYRGRSQTPGFGRDQATDRRK